MTPVVVARWQGPERRRRLQPRRAAPLSEERPSAAPLEEEEDTTGLQSLERELSSIRLEITVIADKIRADAETAKIESEWKFAAMVIII